MSEQDFERRSPWPAKTPNGLAREKALASVAAPVSSAAIVPLKSKGSLLVIGPGAYALEQAASVPSTLDLTVLATDDSGRAPADSLVELLRGVPVGLQGSLGTYRVRLEEYAGQTDGPSGPAGAGVFDLVLDLGRPPLIGAELKPPGYFAPQNDSEALYDAISRLPDFVGDFEKPRYVEYRSASCAHSERGVAGCRRCIDACPSGAITSVGGRVAVDDERCHGIGTCISACPTGALQYQAPPVDAELNALRRLLGEYGRQGGENAVLCLYNEDDNPGWLESHAEELPESLIPWPSPQATAAGMESWLAQIAFGASGVRVVLGENTPMSAREHLRRQASIADRVLAALGAAPDRIKLIDCADPGALRELCCAAPAPAAPAARFAAQDDKRRGLGMTLDHLWEFSVDQPEFAEVPAGAPFGEVLVDGGKCTLCMSCVSVCPVNALRAGGDSPRLSFREWSCVQCAMCETACPESAIECRQRLLLAPEVRDRVRVLYEEPPFECISCGKAFATRSAIERMQDKLKDHPMFRAPSALKRLQMCEDCRVKDMLANPAAGDRVM